MNFPTSRWVVSLLNTQAKDPARFGAKAARLAALAHAGLPTPGGFCLDAQAYREQLAHLGLEETAREALISALCRNPEPSSDANLFLLV